MESSVYFKFQELPTTQSIIDKLSLKTGLNVKTEKKEYRRFSDDELVEFGITPEQARLYCENTKSYYFIAENISYYPFLIFDLEKQIIEFSGVSFYRKFYLEGVLLLVLKELGGNPSEDLYSLVAKYSYETYKEAKEYEKFRP